MATKPLLLTVVPLAALGIIMGVTNPKPDAYTQYASKRLVTQGEKMICEKTNLCQAGKTPTFVTNMAKKTLGPIIGQSTKRQNLLLFSIYSTEIPNMGAYKTLGAFGTFFTYAEPKG
ncbi:MAG: DUF4359 domain-containing protein [Microcystaceae cyanobacterium]